MQLFYAPQMSVATKQLQLDEPLTKHIVKVLRKKVGDTFYLTNGKGDAFEVILELISKKSTVITKNISRHLPKHKHRLHIAVAPTKSNDRMGFMVEKLTEIGVDEITFLRCHRSERKTLNIPKMEKIAVAAMQQSLRFYLPKINPSVVNFNDFINATDTAQKIIATCDAPLENQLVKVIKPNQPTVILIGPEGDFTPQEIASATAKKCTTFSLGSVRYRTETATLVCAQTMANLVI